MPKQRTDARTPDDERRTDARDVAQAAGRVLNPSAGDVETARQMGSGDVGDAQSIPSGDLDRGDVANARRDAQDPVPHGASDAGAPWQRIPEGARRMPPQDEHSEGSAP